MCTCMCIFCIKYVLINVLIMSTYLTYSFNIMNKWVCRVTITDNNIVSIALRCLDSFTTNQTFLFLKKNWCKENHYETHFSSYTLFLPWYYSIKSSLVYFNFVEYDGRTFISQNPFLKLKFFKMAAKQDEGICLRASLLLHSISK